MKKIVFQKIALLSIMLVFLTSCSNSLLDQDNPNKLTPTSFWKTADDANGNITAIYSSFKEQYYNRMLPMQWRGDDVEGTTSNTAYSQFDYYTLTDANSTCSTAWSQNFKGIYYANQAIHYIPEIKMDEALKARYIGEAKFLRAYYYFTLVIEFNNIPLVTDIATSKDEYNNHQATPEEVFAQIEKDLTDAAAVLPATYSAGDLGRATKGAALGYLGKCLLFQKKWQQASDILLQVINSGTYDLLPVFGDVFLESKDFNKELLMEVNYAKGTANGVDLGISDNKREAFSAGGGWYMFWPSQWLFDEMKKETTTTGAYDPRLYATIIFPNTTMTYFGKTYAALMGANAKSLGFAKYSEWELGAKLSVNSGKNTRLLRFSDILLMHAECLCRLNRHQEAIPFVDKIRNRAQLAKLPTTISKDDLLLEIEHQRIVEFADEANRFFDMLRWGGNILGTKNIKEILVEHNSIGKDNFVIGKSEYLPIPISELQVNPNVKQNSGY
jgi:starch-binding outer membrane protein, SusD/RagB family